MNSQVTITDARKVTLTATTKQLWDNFIESWRDVAWDVERCPESHKNMIDLIARVYKALCVKSTADSVRGLFSEGLTCMLLDNLMTHIDPDTTIFRNAQLNEIIVKDSHTNLVYVVRHSDIVY